MASNSFAGCCNASLGCLLAASHYFCKGEGCLVLDFVGGVAADSKKHAVLLWLGFLSWNSCDWHNF
jgi:hypothetical protein